jgi:mono/diheme cytochrome c family protein
VLFALSTSHEIGLAVTGALFITYALLSSFVFPHYWPNFPGRKGLRWYIPLSCLFFVAMLSAVVVFGRENKVASAAATTTSTQTTTTAAPPSSGKYAGGDATSGKALFTSLGCGACHVFTPAGSSGPIGPNLDDLADYAQHAGIAVDDYTAAAILTPPPKYIPPHTPPYPNNVMQPGGGHTLTDQQVKDLVAFLTASP